MTLYRQDNACRFISRIGNEIEVYKYQEDGESYVGDAETNLRGSPRSTLDIIGMRMSTMKLVH